MTPTAIVRQQAEAQAKRDILEKLKRPTLEMIGAGHSTFGKNVFGVSGTQIRKIFVAMIEEFEK